MGFAKYYEDDNDYIMERRSKKERAPYYTVVTDSNRYLSGKYGRDFAYSYAVNTGKDRKENT